MADQVKVQSYGPATGDPVNHSTTIGAYENPLVPNDIAASPDQLAENGGNHWLGEKVNLVDKKTGQVLKAHQTIADTSWIHEHQPNHNTIETWNDQSLEGKNVMLVHDDSVDQPESAPSQRPMARVSAGVLNAPPPPVGAIHKGASNGPAGAIYKRPATEEELSEVYPSKRGASEPGQEQAPEAQTPTTPFASPVPQNAVKQSPVSQDEIDQIKAEGGDPEAAQSGDEVINAHSSAVAQDPNDQRVTRRINPDTGSDKIVGQYFVPGDPVHEEILSGLDPLHRAKLPLISQAIGRGGPFSFMYGSAQQEGGPQQWEGERPTGESRQYEQAISPVEARLAGEAPQQAQRVTMLPMQMMVSKGNNPLLEGFMNDAVMNNGAHLLAGAQQAKVPVPYNGMQDPNLHKDVMGFLENQAHGFMGDGTPMVDENGQPHPLHVANQASANPYVPRLMQRPAAEFVHAMLNIRAPKNPKPPTKPPGFGERAAWQRRVNQGYAGQPAGFNSLLQKLDTHLPQVGMRNKKGKITRHVPWSEGTLEPTWRAYRPELMSQLGAPPIGTQSMRDVGAPEQIVHRAPHFRQTLAQYTPHGPGPAPIAENPEVGAPAGTRNPAGTPGLLQGDVSETENPQGVVSPQTAPEEFGGQQPQTFEAISPSVKEDQSFTGAKRALKRPAHNQFRDFSNRVEAGLAQARGVNPAQSSDTIGDWNDGAENTLATESEGHSYEDRRIAAAIKAHHSAQKQALLFRHHDEGPHSLYRLAMNTDNEEEARKILSEHGIGVRTLYPASKGKPVHVHVADLSEDDSLLPSIESLIKKGHVQEAWHHEGTGELIGDENGNSRGAAAQAYRRILREAREKWDQARASGTAQPDNRAGSHESPWWEPFAREAEENYQELASTQELKNQAKALSIKSAKADRDSITLERERALAQGQRKAQNWIAENEETDPLSAHHFLDKHEAVPEDVTKNEHIGEFFNARNEKLDYNKAEDRTRAAKAITHDMMHALANNSSALGWYSETVKKAFNKFGEIAPELLTDKKSNLAFRLAMAITSQGQDVFANAESAWKVYQYWKQHGEFPTENAKEVFGGGIKAPQMEFNFAKANRLWDQHKEGFEDWLNQTIKHKDLTKEYGIKVGNTLSDVDLPMSAAFGPKIGVFFQNLSGNEEPVTMDLWFSRTMNRLAGNMFGFSPEALREDKVTKDKKTGKEKVDPSQLTSLRELLDSGQITSVDAKTQAKMRKEIDRVMAVKNLDRERADKLMPTIRDWATQQHKFYSENIPIGPPEEARTRSYHPDRATAENLNAKNIDENFKALKGDPRNGTERANWIKVMDEARDNMEKAGIHITNADRQALLWYLEQRLFQGVTGSKETSYDYLDAAHDLVRKVKEGSV